jgi:hypothetical protein
VKKNHVLSVYNKSMFLIKSNGQKKLSHGGKQVSFPILNATLDLSSSLRNVMLTFYCSHVDAIIQYIFFFFIFCSPARAIIESSSILEWIKFKRSKNALRNFVHCTLFSPSSWISLLVGILLIYQNRMSHRRSQVINLVYVKIQICNLALTNPVGNLLDILDIFSSLNQIFFIKIERM